MGASYAAVNRPVLTTVPGPGEWVTRGSCRGKPAEWFFPEPGDHVSPQLGKEVCAGCPVLAECREYALGNPKVAGVWGGLSENERTRHRRNNRKKGTRS